jgi:hypothetical protein
VQKAGAGWALVAGLACFAAVCGHRVMDLLGDLHLVPSDYGDYDHVSVAPAAVIGLLLAAIGMALALSRSSAAFGRGTGAAGVAAQVLGADWRGVCGATFGLQLLALLAMENFEHLSALGTPSAGLDWLGGPAPIALAVHAAIASACTLLLRRGLAGMIGTCDELIAFVTALAASLSEPAKVRAIVRAGLSPFSGTARSPLSQHRGFRAPPSRR